MEQYEGANTAAANAKANSELKLWGQGVREAFEALSFHSVKLLLNFFYLFYL